MKSKYIFYVVLTCIIVFNNCCYFDFNGLCIRGEGDVVSEGRILKSFTKIDLKNDADVFLTQSNEQKIVIEAQKNVIEEIETYISSNILYIDYDKCVKNHEKVKIYISSPIIDGLKISGTGNISCADFKSTKNLDLRIPGTGNINLEGVVADKLNSTISGSGKIDVTGIESSGTHDIFISGSGFIKSNNLPADTINIDITGSGTCLVFAIKELNVNIYGTGDVYYEGNPNVQKNITGSGLVKHE